MFSLYEADFRVSSMEGLWVLWPVLQRNNIGSSYGMDSYVLSGQFKMTPTGESWEKWINNKKVRYSFQYGNHCVKCFARSILQHNL